MGAVRLHRFRGCWAIEGYPALIRRTPRGWKIEAQPGSAKARQVLEQNRLARQLFTTRREALSVFHLVQALPESQVIKCWRRPDGSYQLDNNLRARRHGERWHITMVSGKVLANTDTLWQAAWKASTHSLTLTPKPRVGWELHLA